MQKKERKERWKRKTDGNKTYGKGRINKNI